MRTCSGCGFQNRDDQGACAKCGQVFEDEPAEGRTTPRQKIIGLAALLASGAIVAVVVFGPSKWEYKIQRGAERREQAARETAEEEKARRASSRVLLNTGPEPADPSERNALPPPPPTPPPPRPQESEEPTPRQRGEQYYRSADRKFAAGDFPGAAEDYRQAEQLGSQTPESQERRKACADIAYIVMYREYMKSAILDPARLVGAKSNLAMVNPLLLPDQTWREDHRKVLEQVTQAYKKYVDEEKGSYEEQPPPPHTARLVPDEVWKTLKFFMKPNAPDGATIKGATFTEVHPDGLFWKSGVREGDVLLEINDQPVTNMNQILNLRGTVDRDRGLWGVVRRGDRRVLFRVEFPGVK